MENQQGDAEKPNTAVRAVRDAPIEKRADDRFGRAAFAGAIARHIAKGNVSEGAVVAVMGPWGSGKTSVLNMIREALADRPRDIEVCDFNPWYFSGTQQLVEHFFADLILRFAKSKDAKLKRAAEVLKQYARVVRPVGQVVAFLGALGVPVAGAAGDALKRSGEAASMVRGALGVDQTKSIEALRDELKEVFGDIGKRVVIVLDDLDRLRAEEIRDIVRLVRLVADLPNTVYLLAFDRRRVEQALGTEFGSIDPESGRNYLEKIVEVSFDLPVIRDNDLSQVLFAGLAEVTRGAPCMPLNQRDWQNYFGMGMRGLFRTPRDVHRYLNALAVTLQLIGDEIALADTLALEAVRVLVPDIFSALPAAVDLLTGVDHVGLPEENDGLRKQYDELLARAGVHSQAIEALFSQLFPTTRRFRQRVGFGSARLGDFKRQRRVAHSDVLRFYLHQTLPSEELPARAIVDLVAKLGDEAALGVALDALTPEQFVGVLDRLRSHEDEYPAGCSAAALLAIFARVGRIRPPTGGGFEVPPVWYLRSLGESLLTRIESAAERAEVVRRVFGSLSLLSAKWELLAAAGLKSENDEHVHIPKDELDTLADELRAQVLGASSVQLAVEPEVALLLGWAVGEGEHPRGAELLLDDEFVLSLLRTSRGEARWFAIGEVAQNVVHSFPRWDEYERIFGTDHWTSRLREVVNRRTETIHDDEARQVLELVGKYLTGWRPEN